MRCSDEKLIVSVFFAGHEHATKLRTAWLADGDNELVLRLGARCNIHKFFIVGPLQRESTPQ